MLCVCTDGQDEVCGETAEPAAQKKSVQTQSSLSVEVSVSSAEDPPQRLAAVERPVLGLDGRSSSGGSVTATDEVAAVYSQAVAVRRGSSVDEAIRSTVGHNRHVSFILASGEMCGTTNTHIRHKSFDAISNDYRLLAMFQSINQSIQVFLSTFVCLSVRPAQNYISLQSA